MNSIYKWGKNTIKNSIFDKEVEIGISERLKASSNLGDIDVLCIHKPTKTILLLECKNVRSGRTAMEQYHELNNFKEDWIIKHLKRFNWVKDNLNQLEQIYKLQLENYKVKAFMITPYQMSLPFLKKDEHEIPMVSFHRIQQEGIDVLL